MSSVISDLILELADRRRMNISGHQEKLEQICLENDIFFNLPMTGDAEK